MNGRHARYVDLIRVVAIGVACVFVAAALLWVDPIAPLHAHAKAVPLPA